MATYEELLAQSFGTDEQRARYRTFPRPRPRRRAPEPPEYYGKVMTTCCIATDSLIYCVQYSVKAVVKLARSFCISLNQEASTTDPENTNAVETVATDDADTDTIFTDDDENDSTITTEDADTLPIDEVESKPSDYAYAYNHGASDGEDTDNDAFEIEDSQDEETDGYAGDSDATLEN
ncbi:Protein CBG28026 [Caenorhabditis briggsae]|uniref:Uncharacterized protein n=2 Tax=Caenorhabditis briggsae TaxID=6238 RepID=A0AAE9CXG5_CAEBR|nr:Protein CBG28026 [Caenorhabditis briggsae]ULT84254.1 hypothetical protein L3Y34_013127 [Caenorhabditis briggsae]CAR98852.1 Protein CBG28026 [Caenorhabditis briggsae]